MLVSFAGNLSMGLGFGFVSPYGEQIDEDLGMNANLNDLLVGDVSFGGLLGCIIAGKLADKIGRKRGLTVAFTFTTFGWLVVTFSMNTAMIFSGRIIHGIGEGMIQVITIIYLSEYIKEKYRGGALSSTTIGCLLGMVVTYICGVSIPWRVSAGIFTTMNLLSLLGSFIIQESPLWLSLNKSKEQREEEDVETTKSVGLDANQNQDSQHLKKDLSLTRIISTSLAPFLLFLAPITGCFSIAFFAISMVEKMHMGNPALVAIGVGLMRVVGAVCGGLFVQKFGRRISLIFSSASTSVSLVLVSILLTLHTLPAAVYNYGMITLLVLVMFCTSLGMAPVPWIILGEWPHVRDKVSSVFLSINWLSHVVFQGIVGTVGASLFYISIFLASMLPGILEPALGMAGMFAVFAAITGIMLGLAILLVPETSGKNYPEFIAEQTIKKTFSFWLPDLKKQSQTVKDIIRKKSY